MGYDGISAKKDFWEYDPSSNTWAQKADFGGPARYAAVGFSIGLKGYIGTGYDGGYQNDFWEYGPLTDLGVDELNNQIAVSIYPNPFSSMATIQFGDGVDLANIKIEVYDFNGRVVKAIVPNNHQVTLDRAGLSSGMYLVNVFDNGTLASSKKVVINE